jgi:hypothetical protein
VLQHLIAIRTRLDGIDARLNAMDARLGDMADGQTVVGNMIIRLEVGMVRVKDLLGRMDARIAHLEKEAP